MKKNWHTNADATNSLTHLNTKQQRRQSYFKYYSSITRISIEEGRQAGTTNEINKIKITTASAAAQTGEQQRT